MDLAPQTRLNTGRILAVVFAVLVFVVDRVTKGMINASIDPGSEVKVLPFLWLDNAHNSGAAFGIGQSGTLIFLVASAAVAVALAYYIVRYPQSALVSVLLGLVLGGTVGNGYDRLVHGTVTDFIALHWWPVFNVADSAISVGVAGLLVVYLLRQRREDG